MVTTMNKCPHCGSPVTAMATFCLKCRKSIVRNAPAGKPMVPRAASPTSLPTTPPPVIARLATTALIQAGFGAVYGLADWFLQRRAGMAIAMFVLASLLVALAIGLRTYKKWARGLQIAFAIMGLLAIPIGTILYGFVLAYLFKPGVRPLYSGRTPSAMSAAEVRDVQALATTWRPLALVLGVLNLFALLALVGGGAAIFFGAMSRPM